MKRMYRSPSLFLAALGIVLSVAPFIAFAQPLDEAGAPAYLPQEEAVAAMAPEPWIASGHPVGDTIGRGIDFLLRPVHAAGSFAWFSVFEPPEPPTITEMAMTDCPPEFKSQMAPELSPPSEQSAPVQPPVTEPIAPEPAPAPSQEPAAQ